MKRILLAFLMASVGILLSWFYLRPDEMSLSSGKVRTVVARVLDLQNDVSRQEEGKLLWSPIRKGDEIFLGDKIKTSGLSSTVIQFTESSSKLEIEENSMIVMSQGGKKLTLNMLEGRVFLKQDEEGEGQKLDLLSGGKKLDLKGNTAVSVSEEGSTIESFAENLFSDLKPEYSEQVLTATNDYQLSWKPASRDDLVEVLTGESPLLLKKMEGVSAKFSEGKLTVTLRPGVNYWQLISAGQKSPLMKLNLTRPLPPTPLFPSDKEIIKASERAFDFKWIKGNASPSVVIEVARDSDFTKLIFTQEVKDQTFYTPDRGLPQGEYFWRVKGQLNDKNWIESRTHAFTVHVGSDLLSPVPVLPADNSVFYVPKSLGRTVRFEWKKQDSVRSYYFRLEGEGVIKEGQYADPFATVTIDAPGRYSWEVLSESGDGKRSVLPVRRKFELRETGVITWAMGQKKFLYLENLPTVFLRWEKKSTGPSVLKIADNQQLKDAEVFRVQGTDFPFRAPKDGIFTAIISTLDEAGQVVAESDPFEFSVEKAPLPPAPILSGKENKLRATAEGHLAALIENTKPSWQIIASLEDGSGRIVDERRFTENRMAFSGLMPGRYFLRARFEDEYRRPGALSERIEVEVPEKSLIAPPKIKGIKVR